MSFRASISVYINGKITDFGSYIDWDVKALLFEAVTIGMLYRDCKSFDEYWEKKHKYLGNEGFCKGSILFFDGEGYSEFPVIVDLDSKSVYVSGKGALKGRDLEKKPVISSKRNYYGYYKEPHLKEEVHNEHLFGEPFSYILRPVIIKEISYRTDFLKLLDHCRILFGDIDENEYFQALAEYIDDGSASHSYHFLQY